MANIIIKDEDRKEREKVTARRFGVTNYNPENREAIEVISEKSYEAIRVLKKMEG